jgi:hypothetical protein
MVGRNKRSAVPAGLLSRAGMLELSGIWECQASLHRRYEASVFEFGRLHERKLIDDSLLHLDGKREDFLHVLARNFPGMQVGIEKLEHARGGLLHSIFVALVHSLENELRSHMRGEVPSAELGQDLREVVGQNKGSERLGFYRVVAAWGRAGRNLERFIKSDLFFHLRKIHASGAFKA